MVEDPSGRSMFSKGTQAMRDYPWHFWHDEKAERKEYCISWRGRMSQWFGLSPLRRVHWYRGGMNADVVLEHHESETRYVRFHTH